MTTLKRLNEVFGELKIFGAMQSYAQSAGKQTPWGRLGIDTSIIDTEYLYNHSGRKIISPLVSYKLGENDTMPIMDTLELGKLVFQLNDYKWDKLTDTLFFEYDPIENYRMTEEETSGNERTFDDEMEQADGTYNIRTGKVKETKGNDTTTQAGKETSTLTHTGSDIQKFTDYAEEKKIAAFNSSGYENSEKLIKNGNVSNEFSKDQQGNSTRKDITEMNYGTGSGADARKETRTFGDEETEFLDLKDQKGGARTDAHTGTITDEASRKLTRSGNIGVTTSQQMIESERLLDMWDIIRDVIFKDVDKVLTLGIY